MINIIFKNQIAWSDLSFPIGILISSKEMAKQYSVFFKEMWKMAKK